MTITYYYYDYNLKLLHKSFALPFVVVFTLLFHTCKWTDIFTDLPILAVIKNWKINKYH